MVLDSFIKRSVTGGLGSAQAEVMAETSVSLSAANVQLVARKVIWRLCRVIDKTCISPTSQLEQHIMWDDIANLARYLLMLSFNNSLDVARHLPYLFHIVTFLVCTGPVSMRASTHGLVINLIHSLCTCTKPAFSEEALRVLRLSLDEFSLPKFYQLFGISKVHSAATTAFRSAYRANGERWSSQLSVAEAERLSLVSLEAITDALLEMLEACSASLADCTWLQTWTALAKSFAFRYNPALQPRGLIVFGCIAKSITDHDIKQLLRILVKALESSYSFTDITLIDSIVMCLTRLQPLLRPESPIHKALFWVAVSILQLDEISLYASGLALLEQNLHTLDSWNTFEPGTGESLESLMLGTREPLEWHFKQLDHSVGLSFRANFHFALVGHLIKGYRHPSPATVSRTIRILSMLLHIISKPVSRDKFEVTTQSVAYLAALVSVSEEVRSRCHVKHSVPEVTSSTDTPLVEDFAVDNHLRMLSLSGASSPVSGSGPPLHSHSPQPPAGASTRQKSLEVMDSGALAAAKLARSPVGHPPLGAANIGGHVRVGGGGSLRLKERSHSMPTRPGSEASNSDSGVVTQSPSIHTIVHQERASVSNDNNILLDPDILTDHVTQVLVLTVLATLVKYTTDENEMTILYEYLAEASIVFPKVFPVIHSLLDAKITNVLSLCHDKTILAAVQSIIENMISSEDTSQQQLHFLQSCGFGGLWRFAGFFTKSNCNAENVELFVNCLEALVETCLPLDESDCAELSQYPSMLSVSSIAVSSNIKLSSSMNSISSPTEKCPSNTPF